MVLIWNGGVQLVGCAGGTAYGVEDAGGLDTWRHRSPWYPFGWWPWGMNGGCAG